MGFMGSPCRWLYGDGLLPEQLWVPYGALWDTMGCHMWCMSYMGCYMGFMGSPRRWLFRDGLLPEQLWVVGFSRTALSVPQLREMALPHMQVGPHNPRSAPS